MKPFIQECFTLEYQLEQPIVSDVVFINPIGYCQSLDSMYSSYLFLYIIFKTFGTLGKKQVDLSPCIQ